MKGQAGPPSRQLEIGVVFGMSLPCPTFYTGQPVKGNSSFRNYRWSLPIKLILNELQRAKWFGFAKVDIEIPRELWPKFEEKCPFFF